MQMAIDSPLGPLLLTAEDGYLTALDFANADAKADESGSDGDSGVLQEAALQLSEYFSGRRKAFSLPLAPKGTGFQKIVWRALTGIPYGETRTYAQLAAGISNPRACRAVGGANGRNPIPVIIPCHRVVAANGLGGFSAGREKKIFLLALEEKHSQP